MPGRLDPPTGFSAWAGDGKVVLVWNARADAAAYMLHYATSPGVTVGAMNRLFPSSPAILAGLANGTAYYYRIATVSSSREAGPLSDEVSATPRADGFPSCAGLPRTCRGTDNCCTSGSIPGGTFNRGNNMSFAAATLTDFRLDKYEVTVGRFRKFFEAGNGTQVKAPPEGSGAIPYVPGTGWNSEWNAQLAKSTADFGATLKACSGTTWTDTVGANETRPMNCLTWHEAFAFCAWDGGRLSTEAEWHYAAAGGSEQRIFPWGQAFNDGADDTCCFVAVGSRPAGDARWGQADMGGNVTEWVWDWWGASYTTPCNDCAQTVPAGNGFRVFRGGSSYDFGDRQRQLMRSASGYRDGDLPTTRYAYIGVRCARLP